MRWLTHQATLSLVSIIPLRPSLIHVLHLAAVAAIILPPISIAPWHLRVHLQLAIHTPPRRENDSKRYHWYKHARLYIAILQGFILDYSGGSSG
ncbi:hypothetical protein BJ165DRAFT_1515553 [Panaeolus papilionaceus]|nr:hypothetical protein BJ165DRAFT_1515553 [Panaeolus papilionaceus]